MIFPYSLLPYSYSYLIYTLYWIFLPVTIYSYGYYIVTIIYGSLNLGVGKYIIELHSTRPNRFFSGRLGQSEAIRVECTRAAA